ncbi:hypothetical protein M8C21_029549, partial [Ambrosia artemisiifolia]
FFMKEEVFANKFGFFREAMKWRQRYKRPRELNKSTKNAYGDKELEITFWLQQSLLLPEDINNGDIIAVTSIMVFKFGRKGYVNLFDFDGGGVDFDGGAIVVPLTVERLMNSQISDRFDCSFSFIQLQNWTDPIIYGTQEDWSSNLKTILEWSPFASKDDLIQQTFIMSDPLDYY